VKSLFDEWHEEMMRETCDINVYYYTTYAPSSDIYSNTPKHLSLEFRYCCVN